MPARSELVPRGSRWAQVPRSNKASNIYLTRTSTVTLPTNCVSFT